MITKKNPRSPISEAFRTVRTNIQFSSIDKNMKKILVTSSMPGEGKSTVISNLAIAIAISGKSVILVDMDFRKPKLHRYFDLSNEMGLTNILAGQWILSDIVESTDTPNLSLITTGPKPPNPAEIMGSNRMGEFLSEVEGAYDYVLIDSPPLLAVTDAAVLSTKVDGTILVVESGKTEIDHAEEALKSLQNVGANVIGIILNKVKLDGSRKYGYYYNSYYEDSDMKTKKRKGARVKSK